MKGLLTRTGRNGAFTLVEVMMTVLISVMIMGALYVGLIAGGRSWERYDAKSVAQREVRGAFYNLSRDLRMAKHLSFQKAGKNTVAFSFQHPVDGIVTYSWSKQNAPVMQIIRKTNTRSRVIARNIARLTVQEAPTQIIFTVESVVTMKDATRDSFKLTGKVVKR